MDIVQPCKFRCGAESSNAYDDSPIHTYNGQGVKHKKKSEHVIIYTGDSDPQPMDTELAEGQEVPMKSRSVRVTDTSSSLDSRSRLNLGKVWPVPYRASVKAYGRISGEHFTALMEQYEQVNEERRVAHAPSRRSFET